MGEVGTRSLQQGIRLQFERPIGFIQTDVEE